MLYPRVQHPREMLAKKAVDLESSDWCGSYPTNHLYYDKTAIQGIEVVSNKVIIDVGSGGVTGGKGLRLANGVGNVIRRTFTSQD